MKKAHGFTLIEVLVTVIIIIIIATIGTLSYTGFQAQSRDSKRSANAHAIAESLEKYYDKNGEYPGVKKVVNPDASAVQLLLGLPDANTLVMPNAPKGTTNSLIETSPETPGLISYEGGVSENMSETEESYCKEDTSLLAACDSFVLSWKNESGDDGEIQSRRSSREQTPTQGTPTQPTISLSYSSSSLTGTIQPYNGCRQGAPQYKIRTSTSEIDDIDHTNAIWTNNSSSIGSGDWGTSMTFTHPSALANGTTYYYYALARCVDSDQAPTYSQVGTANYYYATFAMVASWNGNNAVGTVTTTSPPICSSGTAYYSIQYKVANSSSSTFQDWKYINGQTTEANSWTTDPAATVTNANSSANAGRKYTFRGKLRCGPTGTVSVFTNEDSVISAPSAPTLSNSTSSSTTTWTWSNVACPVGTSPRYTGTWTGDYNAYPSIGNPISSGKSITTTSQGFVYGLKVQASCGTANAKVLSSSYSNDSTYQRNIQRVTFRSAKGGIWTYNPGSSGSVIYAKGRVTTLQPTDGNSNAKCPSNLQRVVGWQTSKNHAAWHPNGNNFDNKYNSTTQRDSGTTKDEQNWPEDTWRTFEYTSDLDKDDHFEARFLARCKNKTTDRYSPPASNTRPYDDRFGNLYVRNGSNGQYNVLCDITGNDGLSVKSPVWCESRYESDGTAKPSGFKCKLISGSHSGCFYKLRSQGTGPFPNYYDTGSVSDVDISGLNAPSNWGKAL
jgi:prepilin-type N-terminal cleavage/methylation domain-containing protein